MSTTLVWFRDDLRIHDHEALRDAVDRAAEANGVVVGLYVLDDHTEGIRALGGATRWWLHHALESLALQLRERGIPLLLRVGKVADVIPEVVAETGAARIHWSRRYGGAEREVDADIKKSLLQQDIEAHSFPGFLLHEPWTVETKTGGPYKVYTPFWRALSSGDVGETVATIGSVGNYRSAVSALSGSGVSLGDLKDLDLLPHKPDWAQGLRDRWEPTENAAHERLKRFLSDYLEDYDNARDIPATQGTSELSPYLRFGQISPRAVYDAAFSAAGEGAMGFVSELMWREFCWHLLYHFPDLPSVNLRGQFDDYPWKSRKQAPSSFTAWAYGNTGFPWVDAGQRELWETGHMHNRVRMASASLLVKNLGIDWRDGEAWFWDTLVDADQASNPANWQWVAGCGADAAPFFRIFNPERQRSRFDPNNDYIGRWVPEHDTSDYAEPIVDLSETRQQALDAYAAITKN